MADVTSRLRLVVDSTGVDKAGRKLKDLQRGARDADSAARRLQSAFTGLAGVLGAAFSVQQITKAVDSYRQIENQLRLVTSSARELKSAQEGVLAVANATGASLDTTARLFANLERFAGQFLTTQQETLDLTRAINQAAAVSGAGVQEASNAIRQLTQGIAGGVLRAEEFNSVIENLPRLGQAIADGLGIGIGELRKQVNDGLITSEKLVTAIQSQFGTLNEEFLGTSRTIAQALQGLGNLITVELGQRFSGVQDVAVNVLQVIGANLHDIIPLIEGAGAALLTLGAAFAAGGALTLLPAVIGALVSPLGLLAIAIGAVVAFRDDIAQWAFGVKDAGAVVQAAIEVLRPSFTNLYNSIRAFVVNALPLLSEFAQRAIEFLRTAAEAVAAYVNTINDAINRVQIAGKTREFEQAVERQTKLTKDLKAALADPSGDILNSLGTGLARGSDKIRTELDAVNGEVSKLSEELNALLNPTSHIDEAFASIGERAKEIANTKLADPIEEANEATKDLIKTTASLTKEQEKAVKAAKQLASDVSGTFIGFKFDEALGRFGGIDLGALNQGQRDAAIRDFEDAVDDLEALIDADTDLSAEARAQYLGKLADENSKFLEAYNEANNEHARSLQDAIANVTGHLLDDLIFNKGRGFDDFFKDFARDVVNDNIIDPISQAFAGKGGIVENITKAFDGFGAKFQKIGQSIFGKGQFGSAAGAALGGAAAGFGGFQVGKGLSDLLGITGNKKSVGAGGAVGGAIGFAVGGPIGAAIGAALGAIVGGLLSKPSDSAAGGGVNFGTFRPENQFNKGDVNVEARNQLLDATSQLAKTLAELTGATLGGSGISIQVGSRNGTRIISALGGDVTTPVGDTQAALDEIVRQLAASLQGGDSAFVTLTKTLANAKVEVDSIIGVLSTFKEITESSLVPVSKYGEAIKQLDAVLKEAATSATVSAAQLAQARQSAIGVLKGQFEKDIAETIEAIKDPALAGFRDLARELASVLNDAAALGVDTGPNSQVMELFSLQIDQFFTQAAEGGADVLALTSKLSELSTVLVDLGIDANIAAQALQKAVASQRDAFNEQVLSDIGQFLNGPLDQLERLLEEQKKRLEQAEALGADLTQVERLSALELRQFFQGLSDQALDEVRDFLGLFEEAADSVVRNLDLSRQDLQSRADQFGQFAQQFASIATDFRERFIAASPRESLDILRGRASTLLGEIGQGNESAAQALPQVLNQLVENARQSFGNTKPFQDVLEFALGALSRAEQSALGIQSDAERQIAALDESNDLLSEIRDILQSSQAFNALLSSANSGGAASSAELLALIQSGAGLTPSSANDNAAAISVTSLIGQSIQPIINPLVASIDGFTQRIGEMPYLQRLQIEATDRGADQIVTAVADLSNRLDRIEVLTKQELAELERINKAA